MPVTAVIARTTPATHPASATRRKPACSIGRTVIARPTATPRALPVANGAVPPRPVVLAARTAASARRRKADAATADRLSGSG